MKKYRIDGELPPHLLTDEEYEQWLKKNGVRKHTEEEKAKALEDFYRRFPEERPNKDTQE